jgi:hypothetical protein
MNDDEVILIKNAKALISELASSQDAIFEDLAEKLGFGATSPNTNLSARDWLFDAVFNTYEDEPEFQRCLEGYKRAKGSG